MSPWGERVARWWRLAGAAVLLMVLLLVGAAPALAAPATGPGSCRGGPAGIVGCLAQTPGRVVGAVGQAAGNSVMAGVTAWFTETASWFLDQVGQFLTGATKPELTADWWVGKYRLLLAFAIVVATATLLLAIVEAAAKGSWEHLAQALGIDVPAAAIAAGAGPVLVQYLIDVADWLSGRLLADFGADAATSLGHAAQWFAPFSSTGPHAQPLFLAVVVALLTILAGLLVVLELILRANAIYLVTALLPLLYAMRIWPVLRPVARRSTELLVALVLAQPIIALAVTLGAAAGSSLGGIGDADLSAFGTALAGGVMLLVGALAPWAVLQLVPALEAGMAAQRQRSAVTAGPRGGIQTVYVGSYLGRLTKAPGAHAAAWASGPGGASVQAVRAAAWATAAHVAHMGSRASDQSRTPRAPGERGREGGSDAGRPPSTRRPRGDR